MLRERRSRTSAAAIELQFEIDVRNPLASRTARPALPRLERMDKPRMDSYWSYEGAEDDMDTASGAGGYSPAPRGAPASQNGAYARPLAKTASEDLRATYTNGNGRSTEPSASDYGGFNPMENARLSPSAFDPTNFSGQFILPRFASGGQNDPFGMGVGVMDTSK